MSRSPSASAIMMPQSADPDRADALARFDKADAYLMEGMKRLSGRGLLSDEDLKLIQKARKPRRTVRRFNLAPHAIDRLTQRLETLAEPLWERERAERDVDRRLGILRSELPDSPMTEPYSPPEAEYGQRLGSADGHEMTAGEVRAVMLHPVTSGALTCRECAAFWRRVFSGSGKEADVVLARTLGEIPAKYQKKYAEVHHRTLERWNKRVIEDESTTNSDGPSTVSDALEHRTGIDARNKRSVDPDLVVSLFLANSSWGPTNVAYHLRTELDIEISDRRIQQIIQEEVSDIERLMRRGGPAASELLRSRLYRGTRYPNQVWMMDHSWVRLHALDAIQEEGVTDFDFAFQCLVESWDGAGQLVRRPAEGMWVTAIIDACTRRVLNFRVWPSTPNADMDLLAIAEAAIRFGLPEVLYTDNGADFTSGKVRDALTAAGVRQVFSLPYTPQGRGKVERFFRTLKEGILRHLNGYTGGRRKEWNVDELLSLHEVQTRMREWIERFVNGAKHSATGRRPQEHYDDLVGGRIVASPEKLLPLLMRRDEATKTGQGVRHKNRHYYSARMPGVPHGSKVIVHYDPFAPDWILVSSRGPGGVLEFVGRFDVYDPIDPPEVVTLAKEEASFIETLLEEKAAARSARLRHARAEEAKAAGRRLGGDAANALFGMPEEGTPPVLPATSSVSDHGNTTPVTGVQGEPVVDEHEEVPVESEKAGTAYHNPWL